MPVWWKIVATILIWLGVSLVIGIIWGKFVRAGSGEHYYPHKDGRGKYAGNPDDYFVHRKKGGE